MTGSAFAKRMFRSAGRCVEVGSAGYFSKREVWRENGGPSASEPRVDGSYDKFVYIHM